MAKSSPWPPRGGARARRGGSRYRPPRRVASSGMPLIWNRSPRRLRVAPQGCTRGGETKRNSLCALRKGAVGQMTALHGKNLRIEKGSA